MNIGLYGILIIFGAFVLLLIINPNLSCFGRTIRSPFRPILRKRKPRNIKTHDYGFNLGGRSSEKSPGVKKTQVRPISVKKPPVKTEDYGFKLVEDKDKTSGDGKETGRGKE